MKPLRKSTYLFTSLALILLQFFFASSFAVQKQNEAMPNFNKELGLLDPPGKALEFDGIDDYIEFKNEPEVPNNSFTQEFWMLSKSTDDVFHGIIGNQGTSAKDRSPGVWLWGDNVIHYGFGDGDKWISTTVDNAFAPNIWHHIAITFDGENYKLYVNGALKNNFIVPSGATPDNVAIKWIGKVDNFFKGILDEVRIWGVARTQAQIQETMFNELSGEEQGLITYLNFNMRNANHVDDITVANRNGILNNFNIADWPESYAMVVPVLGDPTDITATGFIAHWDSSIVGTQDSFYIEVATDSDFTNCVVGYNPMCCDKNLSCTVTNLDVNVTYYYRVFAYKQSVGSVSLPSNYKSVTTNNIQTQQISFDSIPSKIFGDSDFTLNASASSGLALSYSSSDTLIAKIVEGKIHIVGAGSCIIRASQEGDTMFLPATEVARTLIIAKATAIVTLSNLSTTYDGEAKTTTATTNPANLNVSFTYNGNSSAPINAGTYAVEATINDANYFGSLSAELSIEKQEPNITQWPNPVEVIYGECVGITELVGGMASCEGTFTYMDCDYMPDVYENVLEICFIPSDTLNYACITNNIELKVGVMTSVIEKSMAVKIYPTYTNGLVYIEQDDNQNMECRVFDMSGKLVLCTNSYSNNSSIDISNNTKGCYFIQLAQNGKVIKTTRIIKR